MITHATCQRAGGAIAGESVGTRLGPRKWSMVIRLRCGRHCQTAGEVLDHHTSVKVAAEHRPYRLLRQGVTVSLAVA